MIGSFFNEEVIVLNFKAEIMDQKAMNRAITRMSHEIIEKNKDITDVILVGIKRRGYPLAQRIGKEIYGIEGKSVAISAVDITFYRDDLKQAYKDPQVRQEDLDFEVDDKIVVLVDDVIYTGRTVRAAMDAVIHHGRPRKIQLAVLIDRGHRELPIRPDYVGKNVPTSKSEIIAVEVMDIDGRDRVIINEI